MAKKERAGLICRVSTAQQIELGLQNQVAYLKEKQLKMAMKYPMTLYFKNKYQGSMPTKIFVSP